MPQHSIGPLAQIPPGEGRSFIVDDTELAIFHTRDGRVYATQARCPHRGGPLADGLTDGATIVCPLHDRMFSLATGEGIGNDCILSVYPISTDGRIATDGKEVFVMLPERSPPVTKTPADATAGNQG